MTQHISRAALVSLALLITLRAVTGVVAGQVSNLSTSVLMSKEVLIAGREVLLGDIASVASADEELAGRLRKINVCSAAEPGSSQTLHIGYVKSRVRQYGILPESINWNALSTAGGAARRFGSFIRSHSPNCLLACRQTRTQKPATPTTSTH